MSFGSNTSGDIPGKSNVLSINEHNTDLLCLVPSYVCSSTMVS